MKSISTNLAKWKLLEGHARAFQILFVHNFVGKNLKKMSNKSSDNKSICKKKIGFILN